MGEIIGGALVVVVFIAFVLWRNRGKAKGRMTTADWYREEWWAEQEGREPNITRAGAPHEDGRDDD
jgi:hypothetical protein